ncbi:alpha-amylase family glycosyl hydrolase [Croceimicrobium sp.]|uniref:alpha-amylase family glycosyl hydrolase n=1 Tax=Croceimicrobium sp. TaxID=2828340 RepID=UPI003BAA8F21
MKVFKYLSLAACLSLIACSKDEDHITSNVTLPDPEPVDDGFYGQPFRGMPSDVNDLVLYEVNIRAFSADGDLDGVTAQLDSIQKMGVNVVWLMPIYPVGQVNSINSPYCVRDYTGVASEYGNLDDLRELVDAAHQRGMSVILDYVANHTSWDHPWITEYPDWYTQDGNGNIVIPPGTNWQDVADLNFEVDSMQLAQIESLKYWIREANIDGFRCDYANGVPFEFWQRAIDSLEAYHRTNLLMLAEGDRFNHLIAGFDLRFSWAAYAKLKEVFADGHAASELSTMHQNEYNVIVGNQGVLRFTTNHDESAWDDTPVQLFGSQQSAVAAMVATAYLGGVPLIYSSQEVGRDRTLPFFSNDLINWSANPEVKKQYQQFMQIYANEAAAKVQTITDYSSQDVLAFTKTKDGEELLVLVNCRNNSVSYNVDPGLSAGNWTDLMHGQSVQLNSTLNLNAGAYFIYKRN